MRSRRSEKGEDWESRGNLGFGNRNSPSAREEGVLFPVQSIGDADAPACQASMVVFSQFGV